MSLNPDIDLLLIGKSGHGKSATGNSILGHEVFKLNNSKSTVSASFDFDFVQINGRIIKIVDGLRIVDYGDIQLQGKNTECPNDQPGRYRKVIETLRNTMERGSKMANLYIHEMSGVLVANPEGYHAFIIVVKFGHENEIDKKFLKAVFGKEFSMKFCVIVMTGGDVFEKEIQDVTFEVWCQRQTGTFKNLLSKCNNRIVLFNNEKKDQSIRERQCHKLFCMIEQLQGKRFTNAHFDKIKRKQSKLIEKHGSQMISEETLKKTCLVLSEMRVCGESSGEFHLLKNLAQETTELMCHLQGVTVGSEMSNDLAVTDKLIKDMIDLHNQLSEVQVMIEDKLIAKCKKDKEELINEFKASESQTTESNEGHVYSVNELNQKLEECDISLRNNIEAKKQMFQNTSKNEVKALAAHTQKLQQEYILLKNKYKEHFWVSIIKDMTMANITKESKTDILLIGKTGNGKSSTGNTILGRNIFTSSSNTMSQTTEMDFDYAEVEGRIVKVVDVQGVKDTRETTTKSTVLFIREMEKAVVANPKGYHAFLIIVRFGSRFTEEEEDTIKFLKSVFGETFIKDYCIIVVTFGDLFRQELTSFADWCKEQTGRFKKLLEECCGRIVMFNNSCKDTDENKKQISELFRLIDQLKGKRYTDEHFKQAKLTQTELCLKLEETDIRENILVKTRLILNNLENCKESQQDELERLEQLITETEAIEANLKGVDKGTKILGGLLSNVTSIKSTISAEIKLNMIIRNDKEAHREFCEKRESRADAEKKKLENHYSFLMSNCSYNDDDLKQKLNIKLNDELKKVDEDLKRDIEQKKLEYLKKIEKKRKKIASKMKEIENNFLEIKHGYISTNVFKLLQNFFFPFKI